MKKFVSIPFTLECVLYPDSDSVSYVIVREPEGRVSSVETSLVDSARHILEVLDEFVFSKNKKNETD